MSKYFSLAAFLLCVTSSGAQFAGRSGLQPMRSAVNLIKKQAPLRVNQVLLARLSSDDLHIIVSLPKQRAYLMTGDEVVIDSPISSGKRGHSSPSGSFTVLQKDPDHHSTVYGDFVDASGRIVRAGVSLQIDVAPSGTHFQGAAMKCFMRLTGDGVGMHVGILPGYPASHGCIRMPSDAAKLFYDHVKVGTPGRYNRRPRPPYDSCLRNKSKACCATSSLNVLRSVGKNRCSHRVG